MVTIAFYKGTRPGVAGIYSWGVRRQTKGPYSHCEIVFSDGVSASSSFIDGGVRFKKIEYNPKYWDFITIPGLSEEQARKWFEEHEGSKYDLLGNLHFVLPVIGDSKSRFSCAEAIASSIGMIDAWRYSPNSLYVALLTYNSWNSLKRSRIC